jgi:DNA (cytosine-5)-methyltransferase 1
MPPLCLEGTARTGRQETMSRSSTITCTDMFCGAGGSTTGAVQAGVEVRLAINHWPRAIETHATNYPQTDHVLVDISQADPRRYPSTTILLASPECTNHSLAKGKRRKGLGQQTLWSSAAQVDVAEERSRCTMWDPLRFAEYHQYQIVILENVVDARAWRLWDAWLAAWQSLEYAWQIVYFNSMFAQPTPQSRDRMYCVFYKRNNRRPNLTFTPTAFCPSCGKDQQAVQSWKNPARPWGKYGRIGQYVYRCPVCAGEIVPYHCTAASAIDWELPVQRIKERHKPLKASTLRRIAQGLRRYQEALQKMQEKAHVPAWTVQVPLLMTVRHGELLSPPAWLMSYYRTGTLAPVTEPVGTITTVERYALLTAQALHTLAVEECGLRMLEPHELQAMMAFPASYRLTGNRHERVRQLGNAVTPPVMRMLMERCLAALA